MKYEQLFIAARANGKCLSIVSMQRENSSFWEALQCQQLISRIYLFCNRFMSRHTKIKASWFSLEQFFHLSSNISKWKGCEWVCVTHQLLFVKSIDFLLSKLFYKNHPQNRFNWLFKSATLESRMFVSNKTLHFIFWPRK